MLSIHLLGGFSLKDDRTFIARIHQPRLQSLLAYLLLHRHTPQARHHLAFIFWPDATESQARNNLRQMLHQIRQSLPDAGEYLHTDVDTVQWLPDAAFQLDVAWFEKEIVEAESYYYNDLQAACTAYQRAISHYDGDLLPGCYDDWVTDERDRLRQQYLKSLQRLIQLLESQREYVAALGYARRLYLADSFSEDACLCLMRLHALNHDRGSALQVYRDLTATLRRELDVEPGETIRTAYNHLLQLGSYPISQNLSTGSVPLFGRQFAWRQLLAVWQRTLSGLSQLFLITGEAGIGKTRLAEELLHWASRQGISTAMTRAYEAEGRLSYAPVINWLRNPLISQALIRLDPAWLSEISRLLPELLTTISGLPHAQPLTEYWQRQRFFEALARGVLAVHSPLLLQMDDLQWCDTDTLEWLHFLLRYDPSTPLLVLGTARIEEMQSNPALSALLHSPSVASQVVALPIGPLNADETSKLVASLTGRKPETQEVMHLYQETEGNPFFVVEMIRAKMGEAPHYPQLGENGDTLRSTVPSFIAQNKPRPLPPKVYAVVSGRLARLSKPAAELVGAAATIGRAFTTKLLAETCRRDEDGLTNALDELWQRRIIREQGMDTYDFSHDKLREVAYLELSPIQRRKYHMRVAQALEKINSVDLDPFSAQLAAHYEQAGVYPLAILYYQQAAGVSQAIFAHEQAIAVLTKGLALSQKLPESQERSTVDLALYTALGASLVSQKGYGAPEVMDAFRQSYDLCEQLGKPPSPPILRALGIANIAHAHFQRTCDLAAELLRSARDSQEQMVQVEGHYTLGVALHFLGDWESSRAHLSQAIEYYDPRHTPNHITLYTQDPKVVCLVRLALDLWCMGYLDQAAAKEQEALELARSLSHPFSTAYCLAWSALMRCIRQDSTSVQGRTEAAIALSREYRLGQWGPMAGILHGWAIAEQGAVQAGLTELQVGILAMQATGFQALYTFFMALLSDLQSRAGQIEESLSLLNQALNFASSSEEHWYEAELYRRKAKLLLQRGNEVEVERTFLRAMEIAQGQLAKSFELRAATDLARLWQQQGRAVKARECLAPIYNWFTEGLDTPDLLEARKILKI
jgi:DNA-binding SARP family transcriptional activator/predicted ATPase